MNSNLLMLKFESLRSTWKFRGVRAIHVASCLFVVTMALAASAAGQDFTLQIDNFVPFAVNPGGQSTSNVSLGATSFSGSVDLSCAVTTTQTVDTPPVCAVSPGSVAPPGGAIVTVTTTGLTTPAGYTVTVTGTGPSTTHQDSKSVSVLAVTPQFTITVGASVAPSSVHAGSGGQATINVNPINGYTGTVTLSCASINPVVTIPPVCTFTYPQGESGLAVNGVTTSATLTINTVGPPKASVVRNRVFYYAFLIPIPMMALFGLGAAAGRRSRLAVGLVAVLVLGGSVLLMPACGSSSNTSTTTNSNGVTPNNTYTFTLSGVDANGVVSSNTTTAPTVSLTVN